MGADENLGANSRLPPHTSSKWWGKLLAIPILGKVLESIQKIAEAWGISGLMAGLIGFVFAAVLVYSGQWPDWAISSKLKSPSDKQVESALVRTKPDRLVLEEFKDAPIWISDSIFWLETEADNEKRDRKVSSYIAKAFLSQELAPAPEFSWVLGSSPGFDLSVRDAFRQSSEKGQQLFQRLEIQRVVGSPASYKIPVGTCNKGDRLLIVIRISWKGDFGSPRILDALTSRVD
jgi:hypothetical protein